jgi:hypothetical protein
MEFKAYLAIGEETTRGTGEVTTVGFIPLTDFDIPVPDFMTKKRGEHRGESSRLGHTTERRMGQKVEGSFTFPVFSEAGTTKGIVGTILKHFFGKAVSAQNAATGQYAHMLYGVSDPFATANLGTKALTLSYNLIADSGAIRNVPVLGARITKLKFSQKPGDDLLCTVSWVAQKLSTITAGLATPLYAAENLRMSYQMCSLYTGAMTRTGTPPNYTNIAQNAATRIRPDEVTVELDNKTKDKMVLDGTTSPGKTNVGIIEGSLSFKVDFEDPASGFSSVDEWELWLAAAPSSLNTLLTWDTGVAAGTGLNHQLIIDLPICNRKGGSPKIKQDNDPDIDLKYDFHYDGTTTLYTAGILLMNTATAV